MTTESLAKFNNNASRVDRKFINRDTDKGNSSFTENIVLENCCWERSILDVSTMGPFNNPTKSIIVNQGFTNNYNHGLRPHCRRVNSIL